MCIFSFILFLYFVMYLVLLVFLILFFHRYIIFFCISYLYNLIQFYILFLWFKQKTAYDMRISDWSSDVCSSDLQFGRAALYPFGVHGDDRGGVEPRQPEPEPRQGGSQSLAGQAPADARRREEPGRPSARRWRRPDLGRPSSGHAVGQADQGCAHAPQQADRQDDHPVASREEEEVIMARSVWKGPFVDLHLLKKAQVE